jgi:hypothetical protein
MGDVAAVGLDVSMCNRGRFQGQGCGKRAAADQTGGEGLARGLIEFKCAALPALVFGIKGNQDFGPCSIDRGPLGERLEATW